MGASEFFKNTILKASSKSKPPQSASSNRHVVLDDLLTMFPEKDANNKKLFPAENEIVKEMKKGFESQYQDVVNGQKWNLTAIPERFQYGKEGSLSIGGLQQRIHEEKNNRTQSQYTHDEITKMENAIKNITGEAAENQVYSAFTKLWHGKRGALLHSVKPENVLSPLTKRAKAQRDTAKDLNFTQLEEKLKVVFNINITNETNKIVSDIMKTHPNVNSLGVEVLIQAIKTNVADKKKCDVIIQILKKMGKNMVRHDFNFSEIEQVVSLGLLHDSARPDGELDYLAALPDEKLLLNIEVKYQIISKDGQAKKLLMNAAAQTQRSEQYISRVFGPLFSQGWRLVKIAVVCGGTLTDGDRCDHCNRFILTDRELNNIEAWWKQTGLEDTRGDPSAYKEFLKFLELVACSICTTTHLSPWTRITGTKNQLPITAGHTPHEPPRLGRGKFGTKTATNTKLTLEEAISKVHDADKVLFFSACQLTVLSAPNFLNVILWGDYGTGKSNL